MCNGHSQGELTSITLNEHPAQRWALSLHACSVYGKDVHEMRDNRNEKLCKNSKAVYITSAHWSTQSCFNVLTGVLGSDEVNVH